MGSPTNMISQTNRRNSFCTYLTHCNINRQKKLFEVKVVISVQVKDAEHMTCDQRCISWEPEIMFHFYWFPSVLQWSSFCSMLSRSPSGKAFSKSFFILCRLIFPLGHSIRNLITIKLAALIVQIKIKCTQPFEPCQNLFFPKLGFAFTELNIIGSKIWSSGQILGRHLESFRWISFLTPRATLCISLFSVSRSKGGSDVNFKSVSRNFSLLNSPVNSW